MSLKSFKKEFDYRHDFEDSDLDILKERWPDVEFSNIPASWIIPVDEMMASFRYSNPIKKVWQSHGQLIVEADILTDIEMKKIEACEKKLKKVDIDLYEILDLH